METGEAPKSFEVMVSEYHGIITLGGWEDIAVKGSPSPMERQVKYPFLRRITRNALGI